jgi:glycosyltransferase involved in cell wall biosynthesis
MGGIATCFVALLNSRLPEMVDLSFVQTSSQNRSLASSGRLTLRNLILAAIDCARFTYSLLKFHPSVTHISTAFGSSFIKHSVCVWVARLFGCRVLLHPRCSITVLYLNRSRLWQWYFRLIIRQTSGVLALSREWLQLQSLVPGCTIFYLPNGIDQTPYRKIAEGRLSANKIGTRIKLLYLGYVGKDKGSFDLIEAAKILKSSGENVSIDIVGDELHEGEREEAQKKIREEGVEDYVRLHPAAYGEAKLDFFREADIFVYPSYHEGLPNAVLEAMACALPVVATTVGGIPDQVQDGVNGILVKPGDPCQLGEALKRLYQDDRLRRRMQKVSFQFAEERYDMKAYIPKLAEIYRTICVKDHKI